MHAFINIDWSAVDPIVYLGPFLTLIKAPDVSGPVTGAAAMALQRILRSELMSECLSVEISVAGPMNLTDATHLSC